ncbi:hypothetical protein [Bradyrhizobium sp. 18]|uniref:hypothetical protein n=1 Tax=Bradyrhizobium sp. 18 TaxID=2782657 RepID=UPI001FF7B428|nr:hypothetical protein [Bradyrhizobium sp. 18]MCK1504535.1 hypothetical protein [Bradyrhizobium sp. 18]
MDVAVNSFDPMSGGRTSEVMLAAAFTGATYQKCAEGGWDITIPNHAFYDAARNDMKRDQLEGAGSTCAPIGCSVLINLFSN